MLVNLLHPSNADNPILAIVSGKVIPTTELQLRNTASPILVTPFPMLIKEKRLPAKGPSKYDASGISQLTFNTPLQLKKAYAPIVSTVWGMVKPSTLEQFSKALLPILVTPSGIVTEAKLLHFWNLYLIVIQIIAI